MNGNAELLNYIHQNAEMGVDTIGQLIGITKEAEFKEVLQSQFNEYKKFFESTDQKLKEVHREAKNLGTLTKVSTYMMINLKTLTNKSPSHISEMLIQGSTMGIIDITKKLKEYADADSEILELADLLLKFEQRNVEECKKYL